MSLDELVIKRESTTDTALPHQFDSLYTSTAHDDAVFPSITDTRSEWRPIGDAGG
jgi:hypothetical protein